MKPWDYVDTPETPLGAFIQDNPTSDLRKKMLRYLNEFPDFEPSKSRRQSTVCIILMLYLIKMDVLLRVLSVKLFSAVVKM